MNVTEVDQVVVPPELKHEEARVQTAIGGPQRISPRTWFKLKLGLIVHPFGHHTWVRWKTWDPVSERIIDTGGRVCEYCPKGHYR